MATDIGRGVQAMEDEAARVIDEAKSKAADVLQKAREEARNMANSDLPLEDVKAEAATLVDEARKKAQADSKESDKRAADIKAGASKKAEDYAAQMVSIVSGEKAA